MAVYAGKLLANLRKTRSRPVPFSGSCAKGTCLDSNTTTARFGLQRRTYFRADAVDVPLY